MNNVTKQGIYYQATDGGTPSDLHQPTVYGLIRVIAYEGELIQIYSNIYNNGNRQPVSYIRNKMVSGWSDWHELAYDIPSFYKNYASLDELQTSLQVPIAKRYTFTSGVTVIKVDDYDYSNGETRVFSIGYDINNKRSGLALIKENKEIEWLLKPNGWDNYFQLNVSDTEITVSRLGTQNYFYLFNISCWWL